MNLDQFFHARIPVVFWGPPGVGKTAAIEAFCRRRGLKLLVPHVRAAEDIAVPLRDERGGLRVEPVNEFREAAAAADGDVVIFLDEITTLPPSVQAAALRFLDSGRVGSWQISPRVWRVAAANPADQAAGGYDLELPVANRLAHIDWQLEPMKWAEQFPSYWGNVPQLPDLDPLRWEKARAEVAAFIRSRPELLLKLPKNEDKSPAWPSPRTWDFASRVIAAGADETAILACVGEGAGLEFASWRRAIDLPDPENLLKNPEQNIKINRGDVAYAIMSALSAAVVRNPTKNRWTAAWHVIDRISEVAGHDVVIAAVKPLAQLRQRHPDWPLPSSQFIQKIGEILPDVEG